MNYFFHNTTRKYVEALATIFNEVSVQHNVDNDAPKFRKVPLRFGSRDKAFTFSKLDLEQWNRGNYNILPRSALSFKGINRDSTRKISIVNTYSVIEKQKVTLNSVPYDFTFEVAIASRTLTELNQILEQILPKFTPNMNLELKESDVLEHFTSLPVILNDIQIDVPEEVDDNSIRIVTAEISLTLKGNLYQPLGEYNRIDFVHLYFGTGEDSRLSGYELSKEREDGVHIRTEVKRYPDLNPQAPQILHIEGPLNIFSDAEFVVLYKDLNDTITMEVTGYPNISVLRNTFTIHPVPEEIGSYTLTIIITDSEGNSDTTTLPIEVN